MTEACRFCANEKLLNEAVQALFRNTPWTAVEGFAKCGVCPNVPRTETACTPDLFATCVWADSTKFLVGGDARLYHTNKFLHYWAPYTSPYNLNPYARVVHCGPPSDDPKPICDDANGLEAPGTYSFSIDDFYGNYGSPGSNLLVDIGGIKNLKNPNPFDPFNNNNVSIGAGWHHARICVDSVTGAGGRRFDLPQANGKGRPKSTPFSLYDSTGQKHDPCIVAVFEDAQETSFVKYQITEVSYNVFDTLTGKLQPVKGLGGAPASRGQPTQDDAYCTANARGAAADLSRDLCKGHVSPVGRGNRDGYSNVVENCPDPLTNACGRPQTDLVIPAACRANVEGVCTN